MLNIIIPCYNCEDTLQNTLNSLVAQTQKKFLVTLVNDCSQQDIDYIVKDYRNKLNIRYIKLEENVGPGEARQAGVDSDNLCEYIMFVDSDDMLMPHAVEVLNRESNLHKSDILVSSFIQQNKYGIDNIVTSEEAITWIHGKVYKRSFLVDNNIRFPVGLRVNEDGAFNTMAYGMTDNIYKIKVITLLWIDNKNSITRKNKDFSLSCLPSYIEGEIYAFSYLIEKGKFEESKINIGNNIVYIYNYIQYMKYNNLDIDEELSEKLKKYLNKEEIKEEIKDKNFQELLSDCLKSNVNTRDFFYFNSETFLDFLRRFGLYLE